MATEGGWVHMPKSLDRARGVDVGFEAHIEYVQKQILVEH